MSSWKIWGYDLTLSKTAGLCTVLDDAWLLLEAKEAGTKAGEFEFVASDPEAKTTEEVVEVCCWSMAGAPVLALATADAGAVAEAFVVVAVGALPLLAAVAAEAKTADAEVAPMAAADAKTADCWLAVLDWGPIVVPVDAVAPWIPLSGMLFSRPVGILLLWSVCWSLPAAAAAFWLADAVRCVFVAMLSFLRLMSILQGPRITFTVGAGSDVLFLAQRSRNELTCLTNFWRFFNYSSLDFNYFLLRIFFKVTHFFSGASYFNQCRSWSWLIL